MKPTVNEVTHLLNAVNTAWELTDKDALKMIGARAAELAADPAVKAKAEARYRQYGLDSAEKYVYMLAVATLYGRG